jgi:chorismate mutase-like protein
MRYFFLSDASQKRSIQLATILATLAAGCDFAKPGVGTEKRGFDERPSRLQTVIARRLALMPAVARWKWEHGVPIEDRAREAEVIAAFVRKAEARGIKEERAKALIVEQIEAAKDIQRVCIVRWQETPPPVDSPVLDLNTHLRPRIDRLTDELLDALSDDRSARRVAGAL